MQPAGFWRWVVAYFLDIIPITLAVGLVFYIFFGFDEILARYFARHSNDLDARRQFLIERNQTRNIAITSYWLVGIDVTGPNGNRLTYPQAGKRNSAKMLSFLVFGLGCLWVAWSREKRGWHDYLAGTYVRVRPAAREPTLEPAESFAEDGERRRHGGD
jgi:uncharacterized RDD family membrane protein YckC